MTTSLIEKPAVHPAPPLLQEGGQKLQLFKFIAGSALLVAITFFAAEVCCRFLVTLAKPNDCVNGQYQTKYFVAKNMSPFADNIVLCGDSIVRQGLYPELLSSYLTGINPKASVTNLAANGATQGDAIRYLEFLRSKLSIKPKLVVYDFELVAASSGRANSEAACREPESILFNKTLRQPLWPIHRLSLDPDEVMIIRHRGDIKRFAMQFMRSSVNGEDSEQTFYLRPVDSSDQASLYGMSPDHRMTRASDFPEQQRRIEVFASPLRGNYKYDPDAYTPIVDYCTKNGIPLILLWLPHEKAIYDRFWYKPPYTQDYFLSLFQNLSKKKGVYPVFLQLPEDSRYYSDFRHLSTYGCVKCTELLGNELLKPKLRNLIEHSTVNQKDPPIESVR
jgi:hypothetical protein